MAGVLKVSEGSNLAIHAMAYLSSAKNGESTNVGQIARILGVSKDHLGKVLQRLSRLGMVNSRRGPKGGFQLVKKASEITLLEIVESIDGPLKADDCLLGTHVCGSNQCVIGGLMNSIYNQVYQFLSTTPLTALPPINPDVKRKNK